MTPIISIDSSVPFESTRKVPESPPFFEPQGRAVCVRHVHDPLNYIHSDSPGFARDRENRADDLYLKAFGRNDKTLG